MKVDRRQALRRLAQLFVASPLLQRQLLQSQGPPAIDPVLEPTNVFDFEPFANVQCWLDRMKQVDGHDDVHVVLAELGDISGEPPTMDAIRNANRNALRALPARLGELAAGARSCWRSGLHPRWAVRPRCSPRNR